MIAARWALAPRKDLQLFLLPVLIAAAVALSFIVFGVWRIVEIRPEQFLLLYLAVDFPHVYSSYFRIADLKEDEAGVKSAVVAIAAVIFAVLYAAFHFPALGWTLLAYLAIFHFIRQQIGWLRLTQSGFSRTHRLVEDFAFYMVMLSGVVYWHARMPEEFRWFPGAVNIALPPWTSFTADVILVLSLLAFAAIQAREAFLRRTWSPAKWLLFISTFITWFVMIRLVSLTPVSFAVFNALTHGIPYLIWSYWYARASRQTGAGLAALVIFYFPLVIAGYFENFAFHHIYGSNYAALFGGAPLWMNPSALTMAILLTPQTTHFVADGFIWRVSKSEKLRTFVGSLR